MQAGQVVKVGQAQKPVDLASANVKDAGHFKAFHAREHAGRRHRDFGRDKGQLVAHHDTQFGRRLVADHDAETARRKAVELPLLDEVVDDRHLALFGRVDAVEQHLLHLAIMGQQALHLRERRNRQHLRVFLDLCGQATPVGDRVSGFDGRVGHHAQHAGTHLVIETIHDR